MKQVKKRFISIAVVASITTTSFLQAEGWFGSLLSSNNAKGADFSQMLAHVPANTSYLITNQKIMPDDVIEFHLQRGQQFLNLLSKSSDRLNTKSKKKSTEDNNAGEFFTALFDDLSKKISAKEFEKTGLSLKSNNILYGMNTFPVMRLGISDKQAILDTLKRAEKKSDFKLELTKCEEIDCFVKSNDDDDATIAIVLLKDHIAVSVFPQRQKDVMLKHLTGKTSPEKTYTEKNWGKFLANNQYVGFGDGFINLKMLFAKLKPLMIEKEKGAKACLAVAEDHFENIPELLIGTKELRKDSMKYEMVLKSSETVSTALQSIANTSNISKRIENPIFDIAINLNFIKLRGALTQYLGFLASSGEKHKCKEINPKDIRQATGGIAMAMNMGLTQFKSLYLALNNIELDEKMQPKNVNLFASIGTEDPAGLVGMLAMVNPAFLMLKIPADGKPVKIPDNLIPNKGVSIPPIYLSRGEKQLNIRVGKKKPTFIDYKSSEPEIMSFSIDEKRYYEKLSTIMKAIPEENSKQSKETADIIKSMSGLMGKGFQRIRADKRGLIIDYHIQY
jgi:hypothetical protein